MPTPDDKVTPAQPTTTKPLETGDGKTATATATQTQLDQTTTTNRLQSDTSRPGDKPAGEPYDSPAEAFKTATGLENVPANRTDAQTKLNDAMTATQSAEGVSPGQQVKYTGANGETISGGEYVNKDGRFFRTADNETYKVEGKVGGGYTLTEVDSAGKPKPNVEPFDASTKGRADSTVNGSKPEPMSKSEPMPKIAEQPPTNKPESPTKPQEINSDAQARADAARAKVEAAQQIANQKPESTSATKPDAKPDSVEGQAKVDAAKARAETLTANQQGNTTVRPDQVNAGDKPPVQQTASNPDAQARLDAARARAQQSDQTGAPTGATVKQEGGSGGGQNVTGGAVKPGDVPGTTSGAGVVKDANYQAGVNAANEIAARRDAARNQNASITDGGQNKPPTTTDATGVKPKTDVVTPGQTGPGGVVKPEVTTTGASPGSTVKDGVVKDANYQAGLQAANDIAARRDAARNNLADASGIKPPTDANTPGKGPKTDVVTPNQLTSQVPGKTDVVQPGTQPGTKPDATTGGAIKPGDALTTPKGQVTDGVVKPGPTGTAPTDGGVVDARTQRALDAQQRVADAQTKIGGKPPTDVQTQTPPGGPGTGKVEGQVATPPTGGNKTEQYQQGVNAANEIAARREQARQQNSDSVATNSLTSGLGDTKGTKGTGSDTAGTKGVTTDATTAGSPQGQGSQYNNFRQSIASNPDLAKQYDGLGPAGQREMQKSFNGLSADAQSQALKDPSRFLQAAQETGGKDLKGAVRTDVSTTTPTVPRDGANVNPAVVKPETPTVKPDGLVAKPAVESVVSRPQPEVPVKQQPDTPGQKGGSDGNRQGGGNDATGGGSARDRAIDQWSKQLNLSDQDRSRLSQLPPDKQADVLRGSMGKPPDQRSEFFQNSLTQAEVGKKGGGDAPKVVTDGPKPADGAVKPADSSGGGPRPGTQNQNQDTVGGGKQPGDKQSGQPQPQPGDKGPIVLQQPGQGDRGPQGDRGQNQGDKGQNQGDKGQGQNQFRANPEDNKLIFRNLTDEQRDKFVKDMKAAPGGEARAEIYKNAIDQATANREGKGLAATPDAGNPRGGDAGKPVVDGKAVADAVRGVDKGGDRGGDAQSKLPPDLAKNYLELKAAVSKGEMSPEQAQKQWKATLESFTQNPDNRQLLEQIKQQRQEQVGKDGGKDGIVLQGKVEAQQQAQQQRPDVVLKNAGLDVSNKDNREFLAEALKRLEAVKLGDKDIKLQDVLKGLDPAKVAKLEALLTLDATKQAIKQPLDANTVTALKDVLAIVAKAPDKMATPADVANAQKTAIEKVLEALKGKPEQVAAGVLQTKDGKGILPELVKTADALTQNTGKQLAVADLIVRTMDARTPGMLGMADSRSIFDRTDVLTAKLTPAQEQALKNLAEVKAQQPALTDATKGGVLDPAGRRPDAIKADINPAGRPGDIIGVKPGDIIAGKPGEGIGPIGAQKADIAGIKADGLVPGAAKTDIAGGIKGDITPGIKPEAGVIKGDVTGLAGRIDPTTGKPFDTTTATGVIGERGEKVDLTLAELKAQKEREDKRKEKEKEEKEKKDKELSEEELNQQRALLALMAARKLKEEKEKEEKDRAEEKDKKKDDDTRRRYVTKQGDTLDKIATKECRDVRLSALIYELNREVIPLKEEKGKKVVDLKPKLTIWLPSEADITEFRQRLFGGSRPSDASGAGVRSDNKGMSAEDELALRFGDNWDGTKEAGVGDADDVAGDLMSGAMAAAQNRRANIEKLLGPVAQKGSPDGRINYIVRLGDTLKSVASKHPALKDVHLWKLLAETNGISTTTDSRGNPTSALTRGSTIVIPSADEIEKYREGAGKRPGLLSQSSAETKVEKVAKSCPACGRMAVLSARICPACAAPFEQGDASQGPDAASVMLQAMGSLPKAAPKKAYIQDTTTTEQLNNNENGPKTTPVTGPPTGDVAQSRVSSQEIPAVARPQVEQIDRFIKGLGEASRLVKSSENWSTAGGRFREQLEVLRGASWEAVVSYEIYEDVSLRHEHTPDGRRKTTRIDLPPMAAQELADNDLFANWQSYCKRYMAQFLES